MLQVTYICKEGQRQSFIEAIRGIQLETLSRKDAGNIRYELFVPLDVGRNSLLKNLYVENTVIEKFHSESAPRQS